MTERPSRTKGGTETLETLSARDRMIKLMSKANPKEDPKVSEKAKLIIFQHKLNGRLTDASDSHEIIERFKTDPFFKDAQNYIEEQTNEYLEHAEACKYLFREFLEFVLVKGWYTPTPPQYPVEKLQQTYDRCDFDWREPEAFGEFRKWFKELFTSPQSPPPAPPPRPRL